MKKSTYSILAGLVLIMSAFTVNNSVNWQVSKDHSIKFSGTEVDGIFKTLSGDVQLDKNDLSKASLAFEIDVNSINTGNGMKNKHAVSDKWFDAKKYPSIKFNSKKVTKTTHGYDVTGTMNIHGVSKEMTIPFTFTNNTINTKFSVNRLDFNVGTMEGMSKKVSNEIKLDVSIPLTAK